MQTRRKIFYGWWIVLACAILNFVTGGTFFYGFTAFFNPIRETFGWTAAITSIVFLFQRLEQGMLSPLAGFLVDRVGPRKMMLFGWSIVGIGFFWMSRINSLMSFYVSYMVVATGLSMGSFVVMNTAIAHWFNKKRSRALTFIYVGFGVSGGLVPLVSLSISHFGWRETLLYIGILLLVLGLSLSSLVRHKPSQYGYLPDGETQRGTDESTGMQDWHSSGDIERQSSDYQVAGFTAKAALRSQAFWQLGLVFLFWQLSTSAIMVHIVPYLESVNISPTMAASVVTGMTVFSLIGRLGFGFLGDFFSKRILIAIALAIQIIGVFIFSMIDKDKMWLIILFLLLYAPGYAGTIPLRPALQADYFGIRSFGTILGLMSLPSMIGGVISPVFAGWIFDISGSYHFAWRIIALATIPSIPLMLLTKPPRSQHEH